MRVVVVTVTRGRAAWADEGFDDYARRVRRWMPIEEVRLKPAFGDNPAAARAGEGRAALALLKEGDLVVCLDERGRSLDTGGFRDLVERAGVQGYRRLVFLLGGPFGHDAAVRTRADVVLALSPLVLNHQVARVLLAEQVYRALALVRGEPYHH